MYISKYVQSLIILHQHVSVFPVTVIRVDFVCISCYFTCVSHPKLLAVGK